jgi:hypothetical protein
VKREFETRPPVRAVAWRSLIGPLLVVATVTAACGGDDASDSTTDSPAASASSTPATGSGTRNDSEQRYPDVIDATAERAGDRWNFSATISSPYDTAERYADAWRVIAPDGTVLGIRELAHDHAAEQPFTRSLAAVPVPATVQIVTIEARDLVNGWGGATVEVDLDAQ